MKIEFKDVAHLYLGCEIIVTNPPESDLPDREKLVSVDAELKMVNFGWGNAKTFDEVKPILRPLSDEDEEFLINEFGLGEFEMANKYYSPKAFLWCLKNNIDLFGLIESGQAISSPTLNKG